MMAGILGTWWQRSFATNGANMKLNKIARPNGMKNSRPRYNAAMAMAMKTAVETLGAVGEGIAVSAASEGAK